MNNNNYASVLFNVYCVDYINRFENKGCDDTVLQCNHDIIDTKLILREKASL